MKQHAQVALPALLLLGALGCSKTSGDTSKVLVNIRGEKITQQAFETTVKALAPNAEEAQRFLNDKEGEAERARFLGQMAQTRQLLHLVKLEGLDKDPKATMVAEQAQANAYLQVMLERRTANLTPKEEDLKKLYDDVLGARKAAGQAEGVPPYEQVKPQLVSMWRKQQQQAVQEQFLKELKDKVPATYAPGMEPR